MNRGGLMNFRTKACIALLAAALAGCNMTGTPDPTLNAKDKEFLSLVSKGDVGGEYGRFIVDDPTGAAPGTITIDTFKNFLYYSMPNKKAIRYGVATGNEAAGWSGEATVGKMAEWPHWMPPADMLERWPHLKPTAAAGGLPGGPDNPLGARALPVSGQQGYDVSHPWHQRARQDRSESVFRLHPYARYRRHRPL